MTRGGLADRWEDEIKLDDKDRILLAELQSDPRAPYSTLAKRMGVDASTVRRRLETLLSSGIVDIFVATEPRAFGETAHSLIAIDTDAAETLAVADHLVTLNNVIYVGIGSGDPDIWVSAYFDSARHVYEFVTETMAGIPGVRDFRFHQVLRVLKRWPPWHWKETHDRG